MVKGILHKNPVLCYGMAKQFLEGFHKWLE